MSSFVLYPCTFLTAWGVTVLSLWLLARYAGAYLLDRPGGLKKHTHAIPALGGCGIFIGLVASLILVRLLTNFPTGTLHSLRGIIWGGVLIFGMGLLDDFKKPAGLPIGCKLFLQACATACLIHYGIVIRVVPNVYLAYVLTFLWVV